MKLRVLKEEGDSVGISSMGSVGDNISVGMNAVNYGGRTNPYLSNLAEFEHKNKKKKEKKYENESYEKRKDKKCAGHKASKKKNRFHESWYE